MRKVKGYARRLGELLSQWIFPPRCPICDKILEPEMVEKRIHPQCRKKIIPVVGEVCMRCGRPLEQSTAEYCFDCGKRGSVLRQGKAIFLYQGAIKTTMYRFKYSGFSSVRYGLLSVLLNASEVFFGEGIFSFKIILFSTVITRAILSNLQ